MELTKEVIEAAKLSEDQVKAVSAFGKSFLDSRIADVKKEFEGVAHKNAQEILTGAAGAVEKETGVKRNEGEKIADYIARAHKEKLSSKESELEKAKADYEKKIKDANPQELSKAYEELKAKNEEILKKYADYDEVKKKAESADEYGKQLTGLKLEVAFSGVRPAFHESANKWEVDAKWNEFKAAILKDNDIEIVDGKPVAISKENKFKQTPLEKLVSEYEDFKPLLTDSSKKPGLGGKEKEMTSVTGIPFQVPSDGDTAKTSEAIKEHLLKTEKLSITSPEYAKKFAEYYKKIKEQRTAA